MKIIFILCLITLLACNHQKKADDNFANSPTKDSCIARMNMINLVIANLGREMDSLHKKPIEAVDTAMIRRNDATLRLLRAKAEVFQKQCDSMK